MILVTGASGLLGASILLQAYDSGREVTGLCHLHPPIIPGIPIHGLDLTDGQASREKLAELRPTEIIHCAAATNLDWCEDHPQEASKINAQASGLLAELASQLNARFIYISTDAVFDGKQGNYSETDKPCAINVYADSKLRGEREVLRAYPAALIARVNIYGWNVQNKFSLAEWILRELSAGKSVPGFMDVHFSPLLANDLAKILLTMLDRGLTGLYHVVGSERISKYEFARRLAAIFGFDPEMVRPVSIAEADLRAPRSPDISLNTAKVRDFLGRPMPDVDAGLRRFQALQRSGYAQRLKSYLSGAGA